MSGNDPSLALKVRPGSPDALGECPNENPKLHVQLSELKVEQVLAPAHHIDHYKNERYWSGIGFCDSTSGPVDCLEFV